MQSLWRGARPSCRRSLDASNGMAHERDRAPCGRAEMRRWRSREWGGKKARLAGGRGRASRKRCSRMGRECKARRRRAAKSSCLPCTETGTTFEHEAAVPCATHDTLSKPTLHNGIRTLPSMHAQTHARTGTRTRTRTHNLAELIALVALSACACTHTSEHTSHVGAHRRERHRRAMGPVSRAPFDRGGRHTSLASAATAPRSH